MKNLELKSNNPKENLDDDILTNPKYICKLSSLVNDSLENGCDVMQMPNGDIITTETKTITLQYSWNKQKENFVKISPKIKM